MTRTFAQEIAALADATAPGYTSMAGPHPHDVDLSRGEVRIDWSAMLAPDPLRLKPAQLHYQPPRGCAALRRAYLEAAAQDGAPVRHLTEDHVLVCAGAKQAMFLALNCMVRRGDRVLIPRPGWAPYTVWVKSLGAAPVYYDAADPHGADLLGRLGGPDITCVIVNSPHNPTGAALTQAAVDSVAGLCAQSGRQIICDEVYRSVSASPCGTFLGHAANGTAQVAVVDSVSKWAAAAGLRIGFLVADPALANLAVMMRGLIDSCPSGPGQALAARMLSPEHAPSRLQIRSFAAQRLEALADLLRANDVRIASAGALYVWVRADGPQLALASLGGLRLHGAGGALFGQGGHIRFCPTALGAAEAFRLGLAPAALAIAS